MEMVSQSVLHCKHTSDLTIISQQCLKAVSIFVHIVVCYR